MSVSIYFVLILRTIRIYKMCRLYIFNTVYVSIQKIGDMLTFNSIEPYKGNMILYGLVPILSVNVMPKKGPVVEQVFLIYEDGRLISHTSIKGDEDYDEDIVGGMLTGVKNLLFEVFVRKEKGEEDIGLYKFEFGERRIILKTGKHFFLAIVLLGVENKSLLSNSEATVQDIEERYGSALEEWGGDMDDLRGIDEFIIKLLPLDELSEDERKAIAEEGMGRKIFELWSKIQHSLVQENLIPKPGIWKNLNWKLNTDSEKESGKEDKEGEQSEAE